MIAIDFLSIVYVDPFARSWHGFSTTDPDNFSIIKRLLFIGPS